jgi:prepilin-type N-terminal cleavage/methylation domain-containing protein/prepilin-type processing-associated H-X9-DG protein
MVRRSKRNAFTLVELLVVISIIGMLVALLLPAVNNARLVTQRTDCMSRMVQMSKAMDLYEPQNGQLPGYVNALKMTPISGQPAQLLNVSGQQRAASWVIMILPYLERNDLYQAWRTPPGAQQGGGGGGGGGGGVAMYNSVTNAAVYLQIVTCPTAALPTDGTPVSYVLNTGMIDNPQGQPTPGSNMLPPLDWKENGVFHNTYYGNATQGTQQTPIPGGASKPVSQVRMTKTYISANDGVQNTLLLSENIDAMSYTSQLEWELGFIWNPSSVTPPAVSQPGIPMPATCQPQQGFMLPNQSTGAGQSILLAQSTAIGGSVPTANYGSVQQTSYYYARPSSNHPGGMNMVFADGRGTFVSEQIEYYVYCLLMSPYGKLCKMPGQISTYPGGTSQPGMFAMPVADSWIKAGQ